MKLPHDFSCGALDLVSASERATDEPDDRIEWEKALYSSDVFRMYYMKVLWDAARSWGILCALVNGIVRVHSIDAPHARRPYNAPNIVRDIKPHARTVEARHARARRL